MFISKSVKLLTAFAAVSLSSVTADSSLILEEVDYDDNVMILTDENFDQVINEVDALLVKVYSPVRTHILVLSHTC